MNLNLEGKRALVFGGSKGIGLAIAKTLKAEGALVTIAARNKTSLEAASKEFGFDFFCCDLSKKIEATRAVEYVMKKHGGIEQLVLNSGGPAKANFADVSIDQWEADYQNLWLSSIEAINTSLPYMTKHKF